MYCTSFRETYISMTHSFIALPFYAAQPPYKSTIG